MMIGWATIIACAVAGFVGSLHCVGMCGPIVIGLRGALPVQPLTIEGHGAGHRRFNGWSRLWPYHLGRVLTYAALGLLGAALVHRIALFDTQHVAFRAVGMFAALVALAVGVNLIAGPLFSRRGATCGGWTNWLASILDLRATSARFIAGGLLGFLPCGLVYGALAIASASADPVTGAMAMTAFGLGTMPALVVTETVGSQLPVRFRQWGVRVGGAWMIVLGIVVFARVINVDETSSHAAACPLCHEDTAASVEQP